MSHFKECCQESSFFLQVIDILGSSEQDEDGELDKDILTKRLDKENFWIKTLRTFYSCGFNERKRKTSIQGTIFSLYFPVKKYWQRNCRCTNTNSALEFIELFNNNLSSNIRYPVLEVRKHLDNSKKKI